MMQNKPRLLISVAAHLAISLCLMNSALAATVDPEEADINATEETGSRWDTAGESSTEAWEKTKEASADVWEATKETSAELWEDTKEFSSDAWDATKKGSARAWETTKEVSRDAWDATMEWVDGSEEEPDTTGEPLIEEEAEGAEKTAGETDSVI